MHYIIFLCYDFDGNFLWNERLFDSENDLLQFGDLINHQGYLYATYCRVMSYETYLIKFDTEGIIVSTIYIFNYSFDGSEKTMVEHEGYIYLTTSTRNLKNTDMDGNEVWNVTLESEFNISYIHDMFVRDSNIYILSTKKMLKYNTDGTHIWTKVLETIKEEHPSNETALINITITEQRFSSNEHINITVSILNNGTKNISFPSHSFGFMLECNGTVTELFCRYDKTNETIAPGGVFTETIDLREYSSDIDTWEAIGNLGVGNYSLYAVYGSINNPWYNETDFPYNMSTSNVLQFEILENPVENSNWTIVMAISAILILTVSILALLNYKRRQKT